MNNFSYEELRTEHERVQDDMISMMKSDLSIIKKLEKENKKLKKENEYFKRVLEEEQDSHSKTLNNISETFNFTEHRKKQAQLHAGTFNKPESVEGHYRTLIGDWYMMCIKEDYKELGDENNKLKKENVKLKKISNVKTDLIENLFSKIVKNADIDDGFSISKEYGHKYIDEWNKMYEDLIKDTIKVMNENDFWLDGGLYLKFHNCDNIEFCMNDSESDEEDSDSD